MKNAMRGILAQAALAAVSPQGFDELVRSITTFLPSVINTRKSYSQSRSNTYDTTLTSSRVEDVEETK